MTARQRVAAFLPFRWLWLLLPAVMLYHIPSEKWVQRVTTVGSIHLQTSELGLACFGLCCLVAVTTDRLRLAWRSGLGWPWLGYLGAFAISSAFAFNKQLALIQDVMVLAGVLLAATILFTIASADQMRAALAVVVVLGVGVAIAVVTIVALVGSTAPHPCPDAGVCLGGSLNIRALQIAGKLYARGEIPGVDYNRTGMELDLATFAALYLGRTAVGRTRWLWNLAALVVFAGMLLAFSKGAVLSFGFGAAVLLGAGTFRLKEIWPALAATAAGLAVAGYLVPVALRTLSILSFIPAVNRRLVSGGTLDTSDRITLAQTSMTFFRAHPIIGVGPLNLQGVETVQGNSITEHNEYVRALAETGVIGFAALLAMLAAPLAMVATAVRFARRLDESDALAGKFLLAGLVALVINFLVAPIDYSYWAWVGLSGSWLLRSSPETRLVSLLATWRAAGNRAAPAPLPTA